MSEFWQYRCHHQIFTAIDKRMIGKVAGIKRITDTCDISTSWPEDTAEWTWRDAAAYCIARECVERETEIGVAYRQCRSRGALPARQRNLARAKIRTELVLHERPYHTAA
jgi:hypothetical protein